MRTLIIRFITLLCHILYKFRKPGIEIMWAQGTYKDYTRYLFYSEGKRNESVHEGQ